MAKSADEDIVALPPKFDITDIDMLHLGVPAAEFALLRRTAPVWWNAQDPDACIFGDDGFWVISRHADVRSISRDNEGWSSYTTAR